MAREGIRTADGAVSELRAALAGMGVSLPSLGVDAVGAADEWCGAPLVVLGRWPVGTARALADALRKVPGAGT